MNVNGKTPFHYFAGHIKCPACGRGMSVKGKSLICAQRHTFDIAGSGYVNFLTKPFHTKYGKELFLSRKTVCERGLYAPLIQAIAAMIQEDAGLENETALHLLDAGCGEGSHLAGIAGALRSAGYSGIHSAGVDISKEGILKAAKVYKDILWCVADITRLPFAQDVFDCVLNIFSPSNYGEFQRVLKYGGTVIKAVPGSGYLKEIRSALYGGTGKDSYSNEKVALHFGESLTVGRMEEVSYEFAVDEEILIHILAMTPLAWDAPEADMQKALQSGIRSVTVDVTLIMGRKTRKDL